MKTIKQRILEIDLGSYSDYSIQDLMGMCGPDAKLKLDYGGCYYPGDHPEIKMYQEVVIKEEDVIGLTLQEARAKFPEINIMYGAPTYSQMDRTLFVTRNKNRLITGFH